MGFRMFMLCLRQVFINWRVAVRLSWFWLLAMVVVIVLLAGSIGFSLQGGVEGSSGAGLLYFLLLVAFLIVGAVGFAAIAIGWHRWVLRDEEPDRFYVVREGWPVMAYIWRAIVIGLIAVACLMLPFLLYAAYFTAAFTDAASGSEVPLSAELGAMIVSVLLGTLATWIVLRIGLILPAAALGERMTIGESFQQTAPIAAPLVVTALCVTAFQSIPSFLEILTGGFANEASPSFAVIAVAALAVFSWINFFVSFGILTVAYGHTVEGRPI